MKKITVSKAIREGLLEEMRRDDKMFIMGEDMAVMGFDNLTSSKYIEGGITTIANPYEDMLSVAVNILTKRTKNPQMSQQQIALRPNLVVRHTT